MTAGDRKNRRNKDSRPLFLTQPLFLTPFWNRDNRDDGIEQLQARPNAARLLRVSFGRFDHGRVSMKIGTPPLAGGEEGKAEEMMLAAVYIIPPWCIWMLLGFVFCAVLVAYIFWLSRLNR
jgi:hypothetical protein